ncbi:uncharacterized protein LOC108846579 [Raphanus sativus]|uniref:Uncharacterized protein LOC108846579 n=1 Tax=Raphanus sativus TaxID=3726 RepID=A0A9W3CSZ2_RAPSA|nr:uncharacterized protein LOC108846579 [Raphanus sativus]
MEQADLVLTSCSPLLFHCVAGSPQQTLDWPSPDWSITVTTLLSPRRSTIDSCLLRLSFQAVIHSIWRERNSRKHTGAHRTAQQLTKFIDKTIRNRISSLRSRNAGNCSSLMIRWMGRN